MEIINLKCNNCGADLRIDPKIRFFNCTFCNSSLALKQSGNVAYTEVLDTIKTNTDTLIDRSDEMLLEKQIARLDRDWDMERERYMIETSDGKKEIPTSGSGTTNAIGAFVGIGFLIFWLIMVASMPNDGVTSVFMLVGIGGILYVIVRVINNSSKINEYNDAKQRYETRRAELLKRLESTTGEDQL